jgi:hypothetical protein
MCLGLLSRSSPRRQPCRSLDNSRRCPRKAGQGLQVEGVFTTPAEEWPPAKNVVGAVQTVWGASLFLFLFPRPAWGGLALESLVSFPCCPRLRAMVRAISADEAIVVQSRRATPWLLLPGPARTSSCGGRIRYTTPPGCCCHARPARRGHRPTASSPQASSLLVIPAHLDSLDWRHARAGPLGFSGGSEFFVVVVSWSPRRSVFAFSFCFPRLSSSSQFLRGYSWSRESIMQAWK